jgi:hypothetical protein
MRVGGEPDDCAVKAAATDQADVKLILQTLVVYTFPQLIKL